MTEHASPDYALLDRAGAGAMIFYPRPDPSPAPPGGRDIPIEVEPGVTANARWYGASGADAAFLYFHGNGEVAGDHDGIQPLYQEIGATLFVAEFRGYGKSTGSPTMAALVGDTGAIVRAFHETLDAEGFTGSRFVMGRSLGSHPALEAAANHADRFQGFVIESGAANLRRMAARLGVDIEGDEAAGLVEAHEAKVSSIQLPVLILHGERDELIPVEQAAYLHDQLAHLPREIVVIPGAGHNDILPVGYRQYFGAIRDFIARHGVG